MVVCPAGADEGELLSIGHPDVLHLGRMMKKPAAFRLLGVHPVNGAALVCPDLLQVPDGAKLDLVGHGLVPEAPDRVDVVVLRERLGEFAGAAGDEVDDAAGEV